MRLPQPMPTTEKVGGQLVQNTGAQPSGREAGANYVAYVFGFVGVINIFPFTN